LTWLREEEKASGSGGSHGFVAEEADTWLEEGGRKMGQPVFG
jgi:hypothetical protein